MLEALQGFTESLPLAVQWLCILVLGAIPFVESYLGSIVGVLVGLPVWVAVPAAVIGNIASMVGVVTVSSRIRQRVTRDREPQELSPRRQKLKDRFDRYGVIGVSLLGQLILPTQITSAAIISFGAPRRTVILWQSISIVLWGVVCGALAVTGVNLFVNLR